MEYIYIIEQGKRNFSAYVPDLPGCVTTGKTIEDVKKNIKEAIEFHIEGMISNGEKIPLPKNLVKKVKVTLPR
jgi:predicted RNase H-like HicB family nuclease